MKLTTRGRYAVTAMLDLTLHHGDTPVALGDIARRQGISQPYLEQLFAQLRRRGLVVSTRGPGGGYGLGREAQAISVADIINAVSEPLHCYQDGGDCQDGRCCLSQELWVELTEHIRGFLAGVTLADLVRRQRMPAKAERPCLPMERLR